jgi:hypothetical protein
MLWREFFLAHCLRDDGGGRVMGLLAEAVGKGKTSEPDALITRPSAERTRHELTALGPAAIPSLKKFLLQRDPSGPRQLRVSAVSALAALKAEDILLEFLHDTPSFDIADPVERMGEDAVINAAVRALAHRRDDEFFGALIGIAEWRPLARHRGAR